MLLTDYLKQSRRTIRELANDARIEESVLGKKVRSPGSSIQYIVAVKIMVATKGVVTLNDIASEYDIKRPRIYNGRVGEKIARACAEGDDVHTRLKSIGMNKYQLEYMLSKRKIDIKDQSRLRSAFRSASVVLNDRDFERHARGK